MHLLAAICELVAVSLLHMIRSCQGAVFLCAYRSDDVSHLSPIWLLWTKMSK